jgi:glycogen synthase
LKDSVQDGVNGLTFEVVPGVMKSPYNVDATVKAAAEAFQRAIEIFADKTQFETMRTRGMLEDNSWENRLREGYEPLFKYVLDNGSSRCR